jgi:putative ABC transport system substrate-binding protein
MPQFIPAGPTITMTQTKISNSAQGSGMASPVMARRISALWLIPILLIAGLPSGAPAGDRVVSVQSVSISPYEQAIDGFADVCPLPMDRFLTSVKNSTPLADRIRRLDPELILAVGFDALNSLKDIQDIPIVFVMLLCPDCDLASRANITGVNMTPTAEIQLGTIHDLLPDLRTIGVVFNPDETGNVIEKASVAADAVGIDIVEIQVASAREVPKKLADIRGQVQMIWMVPDVKVMTRQTVEVFLLVSIENRVPLIAFSEKYVSVGAFMAFGLDPEDMGRQAGEMANILLSGKSPGDVPVQEARTVSVTVNRALAEKFDIRMNESMLETVKFVE